VVDAHDVLIDLLYAGAASDALTFFFFWIN